MERTPTKEQARFGPAQSRAQVFSVFAPTVADTSKADDFRNLADIAGMGAAYTGEKEQQDALKERDQGLREYAAGLVQDGQRIRNGELEPIESRYYMAGVEMGQGRRRGREVWAAFSEWQIDNPRPGLNSEENHAEWLEEGLAAAQETLGYDPGAMSPAELGEYSGIISQVRQRDQEEFVAQLNREAVQGQLEGINSDIYSLGEAFDPEAPAPTYEAASNILSTAVAQGLDPDAVRTEIFTQFARIARESGDVSVLENIPQGFIRSASTADYLEDLVDATTTAITEDGYRDQTSIFSGIQELMQQGNWSQAQHALDAALEAERIDPERALRVDQAIHRGRTRGTQASRAERRAAVNQASMERAAVDAITNNTASGGATYSDANGRPVYMSPDQVAIAYQAAYFRNAGGQTVDALVGLSNVSEQTGMVFPALRNYADASINSISIDRLEADNLTEGQQAIVDTVLNMNASSTSTYLQDEEDQAAVNTARYLMSTGEYTGAQALGLARRISSAEVEEGDQRRWTRRTLDTLDDASFGGGGAGFFSSDTDGAVYFRNLFTGEPIVGPALERGRNLDADDEDGSARRYAAEIARIAAGIEEVAGRGAADDYLENVAERSMVVNRQPIRPVGNISGFEGGSFLTHMSERVALHTLAGQLEYAHGASWWNSVTGRSGTWNPHDPELRDIFLGHVDIQNVPGGIRFDLDGASAYLSTEELNGLYSTWRDDQADLQNRQDQAAFDNTRDAEYVPPSYLALDSIMDRRYRPMFIDNGQ